MAEKSSTRAYYGGEDRVAYRDGVVVCQAGGAGGRYRICNAKVTKTGRVQIRGKWADTYECTQYVGHRFAVFGAWEPGVGDRRRVLDLPSSPPTFGEPVP